VRYFFTQQASTLSINFHLLLAIAKSRMSIFLQPPDLFVHPSPFILLISCCSTSVRRNNADRKLLLLGSKKLLLLLVPGRKKAASENSETAFCYRGL